MPINIPRHVYISPAEMRSLTGMTDKDTVVNTKFGDFIVKKEAVHSVNESYARELLGDTIQPDNSLHHMGQYVAWPNDGGDEELVTLDASFTKDELTAIAWWVNNMPLLAKK